MRYAGTYKVPLPIVGALSYNTLTTRKTQCAVLLACRDFLPCLLICKSILSHILARKIVLTCRTNAIGTTLIPLVHEPLFQYIDEHLPLYLDGLIQLCAQPSISAQHLGMQEMGEVIITRLQNLSLNTQLLGGDTPLIYGELPMGAPRTLLLYNHYDVSPPGPLELWQYPPFAPHLDEGILYARGVANDKGNIAAGLAALDAYQQVIGQPPVNIKWLIDGEGEIGSPHLTSIIEENRELLQADGCIWGSGSVAEDGTPLLALGSKGLLRVVLEVQTAPTDLHSIQGAIVPNAAWRLVWALSRLKDAREEVLIDGFYDTLLPAEDNEIALLRALPNTASLLAQQWGMEQLLLGLKGFQLHYTQLLTPTCTINAISSYTMAEDSRMLIPSQARAYLDFHLVPDQDPEDIFAKLQHFLKANGFDDIQARMIYGSKPARTPVDAPLVQLVRRTVTITYGREPYLLPLTNSSSPMYPFRQILDLPIVIAGIGYPGDNRDAPNEHIRVRDFAASIKHMAMIFEEMRNALPG